MGASNRLAGQAYSPTVNMKVQLPDGQTNDLTIHESGLVTVTLKDGEEFGFSPTMMTMQATGL